MERATNANKDTTPVASSAKGAVGGSANAATKLPQYKARARRMWVVLMLVFADVVAALVVWGIAFALRNLWGSGEVLGITVASLASSTVVWVSVRALLGLYPGYGLDAAETLRRETYSVGATLAMTAVFALAFQVGDLLSRLMLGLGFLILLAAAPLLRHLVKWGLMRFGLWGKPVAILGAGEAGAQLVRGLQREWGLVRPERNWCEGSRGSGGLDLSPSPSSIFGLIEERCLRACHTEGPLQMPWM